MKVGNSTSNVCKERFIGIKPHPLISVSVLSAAAFVINLHWQSVIVATGTTCSAKLKIFTIRPFTEKRLWTPEKNDYLGISLRLEV